MTTKLSAFLLFASQFNLIYVKTDSFGFSYPYFSAHEAELAPTGNCLRLLANIIPIRHCCRSHSSIPGIRAEFTQGTTTYETDRTYGVALE